MFILQKSDPDDLTGKARYSVHQQELYFSCYSEETPAMPPRPVDSSTIIAMADLFYEIDEYCLIVKAPLESSM